jgi:tetratricopeptide (TPR) repeat protein
MPKLTFVGCLAACILGSLSQTALAQPLDTSDATEALPLRPSTKQELNRREALKLYALGILNQKQDQLLAAMHAFEQALQLDPDAPAVHKALIPLYLAFDKRNDAIASCKKALDLSPQDFEVWFWYAKQLRTEEKTAEAMLALEKALNCPGLDTRTDLHFRILAQLGDLQEKAGQIQPAAVSFAKSASVLEQSLQDLPSDPALEEEIRAQMAVFYEKSGNLFVNASAYEPALASFVNAQRAYPRAAARLNLNLAAVCRAQKRFEDALQFVDAYLKYLPADLHPYELKADLLTHLKREDQILPWLENAVGLDRHNLDLQLFLGQQYRALQKPVEARQVLLELAAKSPKPHVYKELLHLYTTEPAFGIETAVQVINTTFARAKEKNASATSREQAQAIIQVLRKDPDLSARLVKSAHTQLRPNTALEFETLNLFAVLADEANQCPEAESFFRAALKTVPADREGLLYGGLFRVLWKTHKYQKVIHLSRDGLVNAAPANRLLFRTHLARALAQQGNFDDALIEADEALRLATDNSRLALQGLRIRILTMADRLDDAEKACRQLLERHTDDADISEIRHILSNVYSAGKNFSKSEEQLKLILKTDPSNATAYNDLGYLWADQGKNLDEAEKYIRKALELDRELSQSPFGAEPRAHQDNAAFVDSLGWVLFQRGELEESRKELERATNLPGGNDPVIWSHLGDTYSRLRQPDNARSAWQSALRLYQQRVRKKDQAYQELEQKLRQLDTVP